MLKIKKVVRYTPGEPLFLFDANHKMTPASIYASVILQVYALVCTLYLSTVFSLAGSTLRASDK